MKETTKMSRAVGQLEKMYNTINADLFGGELPTPIITVQSKLRQGMAEQGHRAIRDEHSRRSAGRGDRGSVGHTHP